MECIPTAGTLVSVHRRFSFLIPSESLESSSSILPSLTSIFTDPSYRSFEDETFCKLGRFVTPIFRSEFFDYFNPGSFILVAVWNPTRSILVIDLDPSLTFNLDRSFI